MNPRPIASGDTEPADLVQHERFLRAVARKLVHDQDLADDVVQDTWLAALQNPPRARETVRAWLTRVTYNRAIQSFRSRERRERRELGHARGESLPSLTEDLEREQARKLVIEAVAVTEEPYRTVLLLRYYEGLEPRDIAKLLRCPVETVRTRLKRGLDRLRRRLDRTCGGDRTWAGALMSLMPERESATAHAPELETVRRAREAAWIRSGRVLREAR
ncbi:MAG: sigma-70 family RNA polymerase sigma factor [Planctomycetes bacterium]|nr:sigma-70 family RNA polymerase sigma factor [Planctomycetota bacterium]